MRRIGKPFSEYSNWSWCFVGTCAVCCINHVTPNAFVKVLSRPDLYLYFMMLSNGIPNPIIIPMYN